MEQVYGHIVYTRKGSGTDLDGKTNHSAGLGIHSLSSNLLAGERDTQLINMLALNFKRLPSGVYNRVTYTYFLPNIGWPMLGRYRNRTAEENAAAEAQGVDSRQPFISEWLTGDLIQYPFQYFDSPFFRADQKPIVDYYNEEPAPLEAPIPAQSVPAGPITREAAIAFAQQGRQAAVQAAVWALIRQFELPPAQRKFIAIRDTEPNVRLWIAAITCNFPLSLAKRISFETSIQKAGNDLDCSYCVQKATGKYVQRNLQDPNQERRLLYMIAGIDPADFKPAAPTNAMAQANQVYLLIDGAANQAQFATDQLAQRAYFRAMAQDDKKIRGFCESMQDMTGVQINASLCDLFDAQQTVLDENGWTYESLLKALECLSPHFTEASILWRFLLDELCVKGLFLQKQFADKDEQNGLQMFGLLKQLATRFNDLNAADALHQVAEDRFNQLLAKPEYSSFLESFRQQLKKQDSALYQQIVDRAVKTDKLAKVDPDQIAGAPEAYVASVLAVIGDAVSGDARGWSGFFQQSDFAKLSAALIRRGTDLKVTGTLLRSIQGDAKATDLFIMEGCKKFTGSDSADWWRTLLENNVPLEHLCQLIRDNGESPALLEDLLCVQLQRAGYSSNLRDLFSRYLKNAVNVGEKFYTEAYRKVRGTRDQNASYRQILGDLSSDPRYADLFARLLRLMDTDVQLTDSPEMSELSDLVNNYSRTGGVACAHAPLRDFLSKMATEKISRMDRDGVAGVYQRVNSGFRRFLAPSDLLDEPKGKQFLQRMEEYYDQPACHVIMLMSFMFGNQPASLSASVPFFSHYADSLCQRTVKQKNNGLAALLYLKDCLYAGTVTRGPADALLQHFEIDEVRRQVDQLLYTAQRSLFNIRTDHVAARLLELAEKEYGKRVCDELQRMLEMAQTEYAKNNKGGLLGKLFGGLFKK